MADLKDIKNKIAKGLAKTPQKEGESIADYEKRLNKKYPGVTKEIKKTKFISKACYV